MVDLLDMIERGFDDIEHRISNMDKEHTKYVRATVTRLNYLLSGETDTKGLVVQLLNQMSAAVTEEQNTQVENRGNGYSYEEMLQQTEELLALYNEIVIKINFSKDGLHLADTLHKRGVKTAMTLIFTMGQAVAAINAHVDYLFFFIGRNEEYGSDAMRILSNIQEMIAAKRYPVKTVAASIKNLAQLEKLAAMKVDYAAIPYTLYMKSLEHPLTDSGARTLRG